MGEWRRGSDGCALYGAARAGGARAPDRDAVRRQRVRLDLCGRCRRGVVASDDNSGAAATRLQSSGRTAPDGGRNGVSAEVVARSSDWSIDKRIPNIANMNCENLMKDLDFKPRYTMERPASRNTSTLFANPPASRQSKHKTKRARRKTRPLRSNPRTILIGCCSSSWRHPPAHWRASSVADPSA
jgi:hypothetical protein